VTRGDIVAAARAWAGTPYHHQASLKGVGCDCLGLVRGVWREVVGPETEMPPAYSPDWAEALKRETLIEAARRHFGEIALEEAGAGDVVIFRLHRDAMAKHAAILTGANRMIHAWSGHAVVETSLSGWWRRRAAAGFRFPGLERQDLDGTAEPRPGTL
jgi:NlpC/P60 family putative phage cell wall peptidase